LEEIEANLPDADPDEAPTMIKRKRELTDTLEWLSARTPEL